MRGTSAHTEPPSPLLPRRWTSSTGAIAAFQHRRPPGRREAPFLYHLAALRLNDGVGTFLRQTLRHCTFSFIHSGMLLHDEPVIAIDLEPLKRCFSVANLHQSANTWYVRTKHVGLAPLQPRPLRVQYREALVVVRRPRANTESPCARENALKAY